jgi:predicted ATPase
MRFEVRPARSGGIPDALSQAILIEDDWNDWWRFKTQYLLIYVDSEREAHAIGQVKIGQMGMAADQLRPELESAFTRLDRRFFSVGQDESYYQNLTELGEEVRNTVLRALGDIAFDEDRFAEAIDERVTGESLLRSVPRATVEGQFRRMAHGGARLSHYSFSFHPALVRHDELPPMPLDFTVSPESEPPTNIHVLIGRNGVGKTHLLNNMARSLADPSADLVDVGSFVFAQGADQTSFANLVSVTFSAFDPFEPISSPQNRANSLPYTYIGLKRIKPQDLKTRRRAPKDHGALAVEFGISVRACVQGARLGRWRRALEMLEADPIFSDARVADLAAQTDTESIKDDARDLFRGLSSGHKIVLLTITRLVESVEERSLVLLDEPEAHLHPPLLAAFVRALSDLLVNRNGVAIIATHSPVVLQEVPKICAYKLRRSGDHMVVERPASETFGENVGVLTREVFGLEASRSGFHRLLSDAVESGRSFEELLEMFDGQLGGEAQAILRALVTVRDRRVGS